MVVFILSRLQKRESGKAGRQNLFVWQTKTVVKFPVLLTKRKSLLMLVWVKEPFASQMLNVLHLSSGKLSLQNS